MKINSSLRVEGSFTDVSLRYLGISSMWAIKSQKNYSRNSCIGLFYSSRIWFAEVERHEHCQGKCYASICTDSTPTILSSLVRCLHSALGVSTTGLTASMQLHNPSLVSIPVQPQSQPCSCRRRASHSTCYRCWWPGFLCFMMGCSLPLKDSSEVFKLLSLTTCLLPVQWVAVLGHLNLAVLSCHAAWLSHCCSLDLKHPEVVSGGVLLIYFLIVLRVHISSSPALPLWAGRGGGSERSLSFFDIIWTIEKIALNQ